MDMNNIKISLKMKNKNELSIEKSLMNYGKIKMFYKQSHGHLQGTSEMNRFNFFAQL